MSNGHRWMKFWPQDWQGDEALRQCSLAARALWMELLCIAHKANRRGAILINGHPPTAKRIAVAAGCSEREVTKHLVELEREGVFSREPNGTIYSRRMRNDADASEAGREHVSRRWGGGPSNPSNPPENTTTPNTPPNRVTTRKGNGQAHSHPKCDPNTLEAESESEAVEEREKKEGYLNNLLSSAPNSARTHETDHDPAPIDDEIEPSREIYDALHDVPTQAEIAKRRAQYAAENAAANAEGAHVRRVANALRAHTPQLPKRTKNEQIDAVTASPSKPGRQYVEAVRSVEEQLAVVLGISVEDARARLQPQLEVAQ